jgi:hypothetical protein
MKTIVNSTRSAASSRAWRTRSKDSVRIFFSEIRKLAIKPQQRAWITYGENYCNEAFALMDAKHNN